MLFTWAIDRVLTVRRQFKEIDEYLDGLEQEAAQMRPRKAPSRCVGYTNNGHTYVFSYSEQMHSEMLKHVGKCAADKEHPLTFEDAAIITEQMRELERAKHGIC